MKPSRKMQEIVAAIAAKHHRDLVEPGVSLRLTMPYFEPLVIEVLHEYLVNVAHVYQPDPRITVGDPAIAFFTGYDLWVPIEIFQPVAGYRIYGALTDDMSAIVAVLTREQADLAEFAELWATNIAEQGWLEEGIPDGEESVPF